MILPQAKKPVKAGLMHKVSTGKTLYYGVFRIFLGTVMDGALS